MLGNTLYDILTIQFKVRDLQVRVINAHGPQEDENATDILQFWLKIEEEVEAAEPVAELRYLSAKQLRNMLTRMGNFFFECKLQKEKRL